MVKHGFLHVHSHYSLHDSASSPEDIVKKVKEMGGKNVTLTDHGTVLGNDPFLLAGKKYGINTIPGIEAYLGNNGAREHFILFAKNYEGYRAIWKLLKTADYVKVKNRYYTVFSYESLKALKGNTDVVATSACMQGPIARILLHNHWIEMNVAKDRAKLPELEEGNAKYELAVKTLDDIADALKIHKENKKQASAFFKKSYDRKIEKAKKAAEKDPSRAKEVAKLEKDRENGGKLLETAENWIKKLQKEQKEYRAIRNNNKKHHDNYNKVMDKINQTRGGMYNPDTLYQKAVATAKWFKDIFPNFYIEVQYHGIPEEAYIAPLLVKVARDANIPIIAANDAHMTELSEDNLKARQILRFNYFQKHEELRETDKELYLKSDEELFAALSQVISEEDAKEALENLSILDECKVVVPEEKHYPKIPDKLSMDDLLAQKREEMLKNGVWDQEHEDRLQHELKIIKEMGYVDYHMVVRDFCVMARRLQGIPQTEISYLPVSGFPGILKYVEEKGLDNGVGCGPGRGSAVGSLVCYMLGITNIDPLKYGLIFERYLNPERVTMPDIDSDIKRSLRPIIIKYLKWRYGEDAVCSIATEGTYAVKAAIQMAGRDLADMKSEKIKDNAKKKDFVSKYKRRHVFPISDMLDDKISSFEDQTCTVPAEGTEEREVWDNAKLVVGKLSHTGIHAGGVVISDTPDISDHIPVAYSEEKDVWATQCDMVRVEEKGFLKMDVLGLNTLDIISDCMQLVTKDFGVKIDIDNIPFEKEVFEEIYAKGFTNAVFQVESEGMKNMLMNFKPETIEDIILLVAAYRPGPMQYLDDVIKVKNGEKKAQYLTPELEPILKNTYSAIIYQEQVMKIFQNLAGYSLGSADIVRRYMSKKKTAMLEKEKDAFVYGDPERNIPGCIKNGIKEDNALKLFDEMTEFAKYAFNKSHACAYAIVSYQTAYLKYHYPKQFLCAVLNNVQQEKYGGPMSDCARLGIELLPPDIQMSKYNFTTEAGGIRFGFKGIKGIASQSEIQKILNVLNDSLPTFKSFRTFMDKTAETPIKSSVTETLIDAGCFDCVYANREELKEEYKKVIKLAKKEEDPDKARKILTSIKAGDLKKDHLYNRQKEHELLGSLISEKPLKDYEHPSVYGCKYVGNLIPGKQEFVFGYVNDVKTMKTKKGKDMAVVSLICSDAPIEVLMFGDTAKEVEKYKYRVVKIGGRYKDGKLFGNEMSSLRAKIRDVNLEINTINEAKLWKKCMDKYTEGDPVRVIMKYLAARSPKSTELKMTKYPRICEPYKSTATAIEKFNEERKNLQDE